MTVAVDGSFGVAAALADVVDVAVRDGEALAGAAVDADVGRVVVAFALVAVADELAACVGGTIVRAVGGATTLADVAPISAERFRAAVRYNAAALSVSGSRASACAVVVGCAVRLAWRHTCKRVLF